MADAFHISVADVAPDGSLHWRSMGLYYPDYAGDRSILNHCAQRANCKITPMYIKGA